MSGPPPDYIDVAERIVGFRDQYPDGSLQQVDVQFLDFAGKQWVVYTAAAYRTPDDERPGHGTAWEPVPGPTNFTRDSELQNAETSAWGRAIVAVLAADTKRGVASANEVRNRQDDGSSQPQQVGRADVMAAIVEARDAGLEVDDDKVLSHARQGQQQAVQAARILRQRVVDHTADVCDVCGQPEDGHTHEAADDGQPDEADTPAWRSLAEAEDVTPEQVLIALQPVWPSSDQHAKPSRSKDLDAAAERHPEIVAKAIERLGEEKRQEAADG